ncbi:MAG: hypothetical protein H6Q90_2772 [Deltaproteobacteria bacterium]|nr:hypothetical protein [Deltaproteobacteria bacterium]
MRTRTLAVALCVAIGGTAAAQPLPDQPTQPQPPPPPPPQPPAPPQPPQPPPPPPRHVDEQPVSAPDTGRPSELAIGIGLGYQLPTSLETPNITSVRFRLPTGLTFEPLVVFAHNSQTTDVGTATTDTQTEIGLGTAVRYPLVAHGHVDLELLGAFTIDSLKSDPEGDNDVNTVTTSTLQYGFAVTSWINRHWQISLSAANPLIAYTKNRQEQGPMSVVVNTNTTIGLIFDPTVTLMVHLYH